jgi:outer membrane lipoprotein-sorting protein
MPCSPSLRTVLGVGLGLVLLAGCARAPIAPSVPPKPTAVTAEELVTKLREREAAVRTLKALFAVEASGGSLKATQRMEAALVYQRPGTIRLQGFARLGLHLFDLTLADGQYHLVFPMQGKSQRGSISELSHKPGLGTPIILGLQATFGSLDTAILPTDQVSLREEKGQYVLDVTSVQNGATTARRLWFDQATLEIGRQEIFDANGVLQATMVYQNYRAVGTTTAGPLTWPSRVQAEDGLGQAKMVLTFREVIPNPELTAEDWGPPVVSETTGERLGPKGEN